MADRSKKYRGVSVGNTRLLTGRQVADQFGMTYEDVIRMATAGELPSLKLGRRRRFPEAWIAVWIDNTIEAQGWKRRTS